MEIIYIIVLIMLFLSVLLINKTDKKENIIIWATIELITLFPYNCISSYFLTLIGMKSSLLNLTIINIIFIVIAIVKIAKDKKIQKYYIKVMDIIAAIVMFLLILFIAYKQYGSQLDIKYETTDPGVHYRAAREFYDQKTLLNHGEQKTYYNFNKFMPNAYVSTGILFQLCNKNTDSIDTYKTYIVFDLLVLYLIGIAIYTCCIKNETSNKKRIIAFFLAIICVIGYPLNSVLFGFSYLTIGLLMIIGIITMARNIKNREMKLWPKLIFLFLLMYGIFFSYYLFVPVVYASMGLYILIDIIKNRKQIKIISLENILKVIVILVLPTLLGIIYFILPSLLSKEQLEASGINGEGYIYRDLYINFIPFIPFVLYYIIQTIKEKINSFSLILTVSLLGFIALTFYGGMKGKVSSYYYFKSYFVLWIVAIYLTYKAISKIIENKDIAIFGYSYLFTYIIMCIFVFTNIDGIISNNNLLFNISSKSTALLDVQTMNKTFINKEDKILNSMQIDAVKYLNDKIDENEKNSVIVYGNMLERIWVYVLTEITDSSTLNSLYECPISTIEEFANSDEKYLFILDKTNNDLLNNDLEKYQIVYSNDMACILEKK